MAATNFERALALVLKNEGGFVNHPADPGGATKFGITRATLAAARGRPVSVAEVAALTRAEATEIYRRTYWARIAGDELPEGLDAAMLDFAVNSGPERAARLLQRVLGVAEDGRIGPRTLAAARAADPGETARALGQARLGFLQSLSTWAVFGRGWSRRVQTVERESMRLALSFVPQTPPAQETIMTSAKSFFASRTVWANLIGFAALVLGSVGVDVGDVDANGVADALAQLVAAVSFLASTTFRVLATERIAK